MLPSPSQQFKPFQNAEEDKLGHFEYGREWRPVYMLERSTLKHSYNEVRTHRALFVGDFYRIQGTSKAYEIRKIKSSSLLGAFGGRKMSFSDAEQWVGPKALDREPVFLGYTDWTDEELNLGGESMLTPVEPTTLAQLLVGHRMVDDLPADSLNYSNCQHFVHDLAEQIIPPGKLVPGGRRLTQPNFDKLLEEFSSGEYLRHGQAFVNGVVDLTLGGLTQTIKFFHFYGAMLETVLKFDWKPFDNYRRLVRNEGLRRQVQAHERENHRLKLKSQSTDGSLSTQSTGRPYSSSNTSSTNFFRPSC